MRKASGLLACLTAAGFLLVTGPLVSQSPTPALAGSPASSVASTALAPADASAGDIDQTPPRVGATPIADNAEPAGTGVRIVRLSQVNGGVRLDRGNGPETAFENLPVVQGNRLLTDAGFAEVEFEDNSSIRLTPNTAVEFPHLARSAAGVPSTELHLLRGTVYASVTEKKGAPVVMTFGKSTVTLPAGSHVELTVADPQVCLRVLSGSVAVIYPGGSVTVGKKKMLAFNTADQTAPEVADNKDKDEGTYDAWDKRAVDYHKVRASAFSGGAGSSYLFGTSDLAYYGSFTNLGGGCGNVWQPYFVGAGWSPYANGSWVSYPSGYSWVSPYPWGWTPFHSGAWQLCGTSGWGWNPGGGGGGWYGLANVPITRGASVVPGGHVPTGADSPAPGRGGPITPRPPSPGIGRRPSTVVVSSRPLEVSGMSREGDFVFRNGSAGLGVPRQSFGKLGGISNLTVQHGAVAQTVDRPLPGTFAGPVVSGGQARSLGGGYASPQAGRAPVMNTGRPGGTAADVYHMPSTSGGNTSSASSGRSTAAFPSSASSAGPRSVPSSPAPSPASGSPRSH